MLVLYIMYDILKIYWFITLTISINSIWTFSIWRMKEAKEEQGLSSDPDFLRIQESGIITILRPVRDVGLWYSQICLIYLNKYFNSFKLNICLLTYI